MIHLVGVCEVGVVNVSGFGELRGHGGHLVWQEMWQNVGVGVLRVVGRRSLVGLGGT